jgi:hypothetical protein
MKNLIFDFGSPSAIARTVRQAEAAFLRAGCAVAVTNVDATPSRKAGESYRNVNFTMADNQRVTLGVKATGDVFEVKVNGKATPLRNQDDHGAAIVEIAGKLDASRTKFQKALAMVRVPIPPSIRTSRTNMLAALTQKRDALQGAIEVATAELESYAPAA